MKWLKEAKEGMIVAGGKGRGEEPTYLHCTNGIRVDEMGTVYVAEAGMIESHSGRKVKREDLWCWLEMVVVGRQINFVLP
jgi:hypothetical protein